MKVLVLALALLAAKPAAAGDFSASADFRILNSQFADLNRFMDELAAATYRDLAGFYAGQGYSGGGYDAEVSSRGRINLQLGLGGQAWLDPQWAAVARAGLGFPTRFSVRHRLDSLSPATSIRGAQYFDISLHSFALGARWQSPLLWGAHRFGAEATGGVGLVLASMTLGTTLTQNLSGFWLAGIGTESKSGLAPILDLSGTYLADLEYGFTLSLHLGWLQATARLGGVDFDYSGLTTTFSAAYEF